ncbi:MAG: hypothetical protein IPK63_23830 [Candidatus Competibacteraceae bacterium]|nr:hypothetical protein [Candidatus Competibacteraceae bacterium]
MRKYGLGLSYQRLYGRAIAGVFPGVEYQGRLPCAISDPKDIAKAIRAEERRSAGGYPLASRLEGRPHGTLRCSQYQPPNPTRHRLRQSARWWRSNARIPGKKNAAKRGAALKIFFAYKRKLIMPQTPQICTPAESRAAHKPNATVVARGDLSGDVQPGPAAPLQSASTSICWPVTRTPDPASLAPCAETGTAGAAFINWPHGPRGPLFSLTWTGNPPARWRKTNPALCQVEADHLESQ